eukprot:9195641-Alexandrium_andersonii.AAC.1
MGAPPQDGPSPGGGALHPAAPLAPPCASEPASAGGPPGWPAALRRAEGGAFTGTDADGAPAGVLAELGGLPGGGGG